MVVVGGSGVGDATVASNLEGLKKQIQLTLRCVLVANVSAVVLVSVPI